MKIKFKYIKAFLVACLKKEKIVTHKKNQAFVMLSANYNNLGDIAITLAQELFLNEFLPSDYEVIVIPHDRTYNVFLSMRKIINENSIITLIGGGNTGTLYEFIEAPRRFILRFFHKSRIISFPQSVYYGSDKKGSVYKKEFIKLCKKCSDLTLIARENQSYINYQMMLKDSVTILLTPDIVFSLSTFKKEQNCRGVSFILRTDKEKEDNADIENIILDYCKDNFDNISYNDTCKVKIIGNGYKELENFITELSGKKLIVTDRLHGMILAYITGIPCIALDNNNHKVKSTYETWLKDQTIVYLNTNSNNLSENISSVMEGEGKNIRSKFAPIINIFSQ